LVFLTPSGVTSKIQENIIAMGNPMARSTITNVGVQSGRLKGSATLLMSSIITNATAA